MPQFLTFIAAALLLTHSWGLWADPAEQSSSELFTDVSRQAGITRPFVGWGARFIDYDNDSDLDLVVSSRRPATPRTGTGA